MGAKLWLAAAAAALTAVAPGPTADGGTPTSSCCGETCRRSGASPPLQLWWSWKDQIVVDQNQESGRLYREIKRIDPHAPVLQIVGYWRHSAEFKASRRLPLALELFGLLPPYRTRDVSSPGA